MKLSFESGEFISNPHEQDLARITREDFAILETEPNSYMQCAQQADRPGEFALEYQVGSTDYHFVAVDEPITARRVFDAFRKYLYGDDTWLDDFQWEKLDL